MLNVRLDYLSKDVARLSALLIDQRDARTVISSTSRSAPSIIARRGALPYTGRGTSVARRKKEAHLFMPELDN